MFLDDPNNPICIFADKIDEILVKLEIPVLVIALAGIILEAIEIDAGQIIYINGMIILALLYLTTSFTSAMQESTAMPVGWKSMLHKCTHWSYAVAVTGMLFFITEWPGYNIMLICSSVSLLIILFLTTKAIHKHDAGDEYGQSFWMRFMLITGFSCYSVYKMFLPDVLALLSHN